MTRGMSPGRPALLIAAVTGHARPGAAGGGHRARDRRSDRRRVPSSSSGRHRPPCIRGGGRRRPDMARHGCCRARSPATSPRARPSRPSRASCGGSSIRRGRVAGVDGHDAGAASASFGARHGPDLHPGVAASAPTWAQVAFVVVALAMMTGKSLPVQASLWVLPLAAASGALAGHAHLGGDRDRLLHRRLALYRALTRPDRALPGRGTRCSWSSGWRHRLAGLAGLAGGALSSTCGRHEAAGPGTSCWHHHGQERRGSRQPELAFATRARDRDSPEPAFPADGDPDGVGSRGPLCCIDIIAA